jgi:hypothetical protein
MQLSPLIQKISGYAMGGHASLVEVLAVMGGTTAAVLLIVWLLRRRQSQAERPLSQT